MLSAALSTAPRKLFRRLTSWDRGTCIFFVAFFLTFIAFNLLWCSWTTFTPFSHAPLYVSTLLFSLILTLPYAMWRQKWIEILLLVLLDFLLTANLMYARTYFNAIPLTSYTNAGNLADFMPSVWASVRWTDIVFPIITLSAIWMTCRPGALLTSGQRTDRAGYLTLLAIPVIITLITFPTLSRFKEHYSSYATNAYAYQSTPVMYSIFGKLLYDSLVVTEVLTPQQQASTMKYLESLPEVEPLPQGVNPPLNLVVVFCESLESWQVELAFDGKPVMPRVAAMLRDSTTFYDPHVLSQAADGRSIDGQLLVLTGLLPLSQGTYATMYPDNYYPSIHKALKQAHGSRATLMTGDKPYAWNQERIGRNFGLDSLITFADFRIDDDFAGRRHIGDRALMQQCVEKLKKGDIWPVNSPAFLQFVTYSGHGPFRLPESEKKMKLPQGLPTIMADYLHTAHYTDEAIGILVDYLRSRPDWHRTMVVITGDHEGLATWRQECLDSPEGRKYVSAEKFVPLIILNSPIPGRSDRVMGQVDIYSSLLQLMGLTHYHWRGLGHSIFSPTHPGMAVDPQHHIVPAGSETSPEANRLREAREMSDRIIRYNLLAPASERN